MSTIIQRSFASGEIAPALYARVDFFKYQSGLRTCRNFFIMRHGGATNRPGTKFVGEAREFEKITRLIPFVFNDDQTFVLEFGDLYVRFIQNGSYVREAATTITGITAANPAVVTTSGSHGYSAGDTVYINNVLGMLEANNRTFKVGSVTATTFQLLSIPGTNVDSSGYTAYVSGGTAERDYKLTTPYSLTALSGMRFAQSADVVTIVTDQQRPRQLSRVGALNWTLTVIATAPAIVAPTISSASAGSGSAAFSYTVTSVAEENYEESLPATPVTGTTGPGTVGAPIAISFGTVTGAQEYNVYRLENGINSLIGVSGGTVFRDVGQDSDGSKTPPISRDLFTVGGEYPTAVAYFQQRVLFANTTDEPEKVWASRIGLFKNFSISSPLQDDDAITFTLAGKQVNQIKHMIDIGKLVLFTSAGEWTLEGSSGGPLTPSNISLKQQSYNGSSDLTPIIIGNSSLYVQARGSIVRDLGFDFAVDGYKGNDLTIFSAHLFDDYTLVDWSYQQVPHSVLWCVRSDGVLLALTYVREQSLLAWSRHDFSGGFVENVCVVPEGNEDILYVTVKRTVDGVEGRYVERMNTRNIIEVEDTTFLDSYLTYDGRNTSATTMTLTGGTDWLYTETLTLTASVATFAATDVGNAIHLTDSAGDIIRATITGYTSTTVVSVQPNKTVPVSLRGVAVTLWRRAVDQLVGLWHLEGEQVSVFADGFVVANPNNDAYDVVTVENGSITLDKAYGLIHVGLPIIADIETLNIDSVQSETLADKYKATKNVTLFVEESRGLFVGARPPSNDTVDPLEGLTELKIRNDEGYDEPVRMKTGTIDVNIRPEWNSNGRVFLRQVDPIPISVLAIAPAGEYPFKN